MIAEPTRAWLLFVARRALADALGVGYEPSVEPQRPDDPRLDAKARLFVSWHKGDKLAGCIGTLEPRLSLEGAVKVYAVESGLNDPRLPAARREDLPQLSCDISVLSEPVPMDVMGIDAIRDRLRPGEDGLILRDGARRAVFLPVVWDNLPDPDAFVDALCRKARIDRSLRGPFVIGERFTAEKISDE